MILVCVCVYCVLCIGVWRKCVATCYQWVVNVCECVCVCVCVCVRVRL